MQFKHYRDQNSGQYFKKGASGEQRSPPRGKPNKNPETKFFDGRKYDIKGLTIWCEQGKIGLDMNAKVIKKIAKYIGRRDTDGGDVRLVIETTADPFLPFYT